MADARQEADWAIASHHMAILLNVNRGQGKPEIKPEQCNLYRLGKSAAQAKRSPEEHEMGTVRDFARAVLGRIPGDD